MKTTHRKWEANRYRANNQCPCGKSNRDGKFATEKGFVGKPVGKCHSCNQNFWDDNTSISAGTSLLPATYIQEQYQYEVPQFCKPNFEDLKKTFDFDLQSGFARYLVKTFGKEAADKAVEKYFLGVYDPHGGSKHPRTIYWQLDQYETLRAGKVIAYGEDGKRIKSQYANWYHKLEGQDCPIRQCLFGEHLIPDYDLPVAIVEGEKTAVIMSILQPQWIWISCGGSTALTDNKCHSISKYDVTLFPDAGWYDGTEKNRVYWKAIADKFDFEISKDCEIWKQEGLIADGDDIADYFINRYASSNLLASVFEVEEFEKVDAEWNQAEWDDLEERMKKRLRRNLLSNPPD